MTDDALRQPIPVAIELLQNCLNLFLKLGHCIKNIFISVRFKYTKL